MGHALNSLNIAAAPPPPSNAYPQQQELQQQPLSVAPSPSYSISNQDLMSSSLHGPASMQAQHYSTPKASSHRTHRRTPSTAGPMSLMSASMYTPSAFFPPPPRPLIWHSSPYSSPSPSLSLQQQSNSAYYTPELKYPSTSVNNASSRYFTPRTSQTPNGGACAEGAHYSNPKQRMEVHIE